MYFLSALASPSLFKKVSASCFLEGKNNRIRASKMFAIDCLRGPILFKLLLWMSRVFNDFIKDDFIPGGDRQVA